MESRLSRITRTPLHVDKVNSTPFERELSVLTTYRVKQNATVMSVNLIRALSLNQTAPITQTILHVDKVNLTPFERERITELTVLTTYIN